MEHVQAYIEYRNIVGDADNGQLLSEEEYAKFKQKAMESRKNRIYVSWRNIKNQEDCKLVGPATKCITARYPSNFQVSVATHTEITQRKMAKLCHVANQNVNVNNTSMYQFVSFNYIPSKIHHPSLSSYGAFTIKCRCKHLYSQHTVNGTKSCAKAGCTCADFYSPMSCSCKDLWKDHVTVFETREERLALGKPVDNLAEGGLGYEALGGITSYSSLVESYTPIRKDEEEEERKLIKP